MSSESKKKPGTVTPAQSLTIAKYVIIAAIALFVAFCVYTQHQGNVPFDQVRDAVVQAIDQESMRDAGSRGFVRFYGLNSAEYDGILLYQSTSGMSADEVLLVKLKDRNQLDALLETINSRKEARTSDFSGYAPAEAAIMEEAEILTKGKYVLFLPYSGAADVKQAFLKALGE